MGEGTAEARGVAPKGSGELAQVVAGSTIHAVAEVDEEVTNAEEVAVTDVCEMAEEEGSDATVEQVGSAAAISEAGSGKAGKAGELMVEEV